MTHSCCCFLPFYIRAATLHNNAADAETESAAGKLNQVFPQPALMEKGLTPLCSLPPADPLGSPGRGCLQTEPCPRMLRGARSAGSGSGEQRGSRSLERPPSPSTCHPGFTRGDQKQTLSPNPTTTDEGIQKNQQILKAQKQMEFDG